MKTLAKENNGLTQFAEYLISGGIYFWVGYLSFAFLYGNSENSWPSLHWNLWWATITSNVIGWTANYLMQRYWVFKNSGLRSHQTQITQRYVLITIFDFVLNYLILYALRAVGITPYAGQFISAAFFTLWNYVWYRWWVFPEKYSPNFRPKITAGRMLVHIPHGHHSY